jgi:tRNA (guanine37-N1)-methyltransferase
VRQLFDIWSHSQIDCKPAELSQEAQDFLAEHATLVEHELALNYDYWLAGLECRISLPMGSQISSDEILAAILPEELLSGAPSGFSSTGHIGTSTLLEGFFY